MRKGLQTMRDKQKKGKALLKGLGIGLLLFAGNGCGLISRLFHPETTPATVVELDPLCDSNTADVVVYVEKHGLFLEDGPESYANLMARLEVDDHALEAHEFAACYQAIARQVREWENKNPQPKEGN